MLLTPLQHEEILALVIGAGQEVLRRQSGPLNVRMKSAEEASVLTDADFISRNILKSGFEKILPGIRIITEEDESFSDDSPNQTAILIDPIDGSRNYAKGKAGFSILVGIIENGEPTQGIAYSPALKFQELFYTGPDGKGAFQSRVTVDEQGTPHITETKRLSTVPAEHPPRLMQACTDVRHHFPDGCKIIEPPNGAMIAMLQGRTDIAAGPEKMGWDLAAFDALARQAGAVFIDAETKQPLCYGRTGIQPLPVYLAANCQTFKALKFF